METWKKCERLLIEGPFMQKKTNFDKPIGSQGCILSKCCKNKKLKFCHYFQVLFNAKLLFSNPGNDPPFSCDFDEPLWPQGCVKQNCCIKPNVNAFESPSSIVFYKSPNSQLSSSEPGNGPLYGILTTP